MDADVTSSSMLTAQISRLNPIPFGETLVSVQSNYEFSPVDLSQGGLNNAFVFDFVRLTSEMAPSLFSILIRDAKEFFLYSVSPFVLKHDPFTVVVPFDRFTFRDGQPGMPDYTTVESVSVSIRVSEIAGGGPDPLNFFMQLDRIRVERIPEQESFALFVGGLVAIVCRRCRQPTIFYGG
jgi:hypothetical protein